MPVANRLYDQNHEIPANGGKVIDLWAVEEDWAFPVSGALALQPEPLEEPEEVASAPPGAPAAAEVQFETHGHLG